MIYLVFATFGAPSMLARIHPLIILICIESLPTALWLITTVFWSLGAADTPLAAFLDQFTDGGYFDTNYGEGYEPYFSQAKIDSTVAASYATPAIAGLIM